jgi:hypothetical protein
VPGGGDLGDLEARPHRGAPDGLKGRPEGGR